MLDPARQVDVPEFPHARVYRDHEQPRTYYVVPWAPAISIDDNGRPECRLLLYMKREGDHSVATGGQVSVTTILAIPDGDLSQIKKSIEASLTPPAPPRSEPPPRPVVVQLSSPDWVSGRVSVAFTPALTVSGQPSLFGDNRCVLMSPLTPDQAGTLRERWPHGLPDARIVYEMAMRVAVVSAASARVREENVTVGAYDVTGATRAFDVDVHGTSAQVQPITVDGPFAADGLEALITEIDLSH